MAEAGRGLISDTFGRLPIGRAIGFGISRVVPLDTHHADSLIRSQRPGRRQSRNQLNFMMQLVSAGSMATAKPRLSKSFDRQPWRRAADRPETACRCRKLLE